MSEKYKDEQELIDRLAQYMDSEGDSKYAAGLCLANHLWFGEQQDKAREIIQELTGIQADSSKTMTQKVREFVDIKEIPFRITEVFDALQSIKNPEQRQRDRNTIRQIMHRLTKDGILQNYGSIDGAYRKVNKGAELLDWKNAKSEGVKFHLPFDMDDLGINIFWGNIITISGEKGAGKTALCLEIAKTNMDIIKTQYASSEMWESETRSRLEYHEDIPIDEWDKVRFIHRNKDLADVVEKEWLNIFDFLELKQGASFEVGDRLQEIHDALGGTGIAVVALQLDRGKDIARGGSSSLDKPRLIVNLRKGSTKRLGTLKIYDAKNLKRRVQNPSGKILHFKLVEGTVFIPQGTWHYEEDCSEETCGFSKKSGGYS